MAIRQGRLAEAQAARGVTELTLGVTLAVLGAGLLHAGWNALLKSAPGGDPLLDTATVVAGSGGLRPRRASVRRRCRCRGVEVHAAVSSIIHWGYYLTLAHAYRTGDLSFAYPLMRGTAPLLVTLLGIVFLREWPTPQVALGIAAHLRSASSASRSSRREAHPPAAACWALANAAIIAVYTLVDGAGARASGNALATSRGSSSSRRSRSSPGSATRRGRAAVAYIAPRLAARPPRRRGEPRRLRHRAVGDDARAGRRRRRAARDVGAVRRADRRRLC